MDRRLGIVAVAVVVVVVAGGMWLWLGGESSPPEDWRYEGIGDLAEVAFEPPSEDKRAMERGEEGRWVWRQPVEGRVDREVARHLEEVLSSDMEADDWAVHVDKGQDYGLGDEEGVVLRARGEGGEERHLVVGEERQIEEVGGVRTFIRWADEDWIVRVPQRLGEVLRLPMDELRHREVMRIGEEGIERVSIRHQDGHEVHVEQRGGRWRLVDGPAAVRGLEGDRGQRLAATVGRLEAKRVVDKSPEELGFDAVDVEVKVVTSQGERRVEIRRGDDGEYWVRQVEDGRIYELDEEVGAIVTARLSDLRDRRLVGLPEEELTEIRLAGDNPVHLRRTDEGRWTAVGEDDFDIDGEQVERLAGYVARLRVERWLDETTTEGRGFGDEAMEVLIGIDGERYRLQIGDRLEGRSGQHYGQYEGAHGIFTISRGTVERLTWSVDDIRLSDRD